MFRSSQQRIWLPESKTIVNRSAESPKRQRSTGTRNDGGEGRSSSSRRRRRVADKLAIVWIWRRWIHRVLLQRWRRRSRCDWGERLRELNFEESERQSRRSSEGFIFFNQLNVPSFIDSTTMISNSNIEFFNTEFAETWNKENRSWFKVDSIHNQGDEWLVEAWIPRTQRHIGGIEWLIKYKLFRFSNVSNYNKPISPFLKLKHKMIKISSLINVLQNSKRMDW